MRQNNHSGHWGIKPLPTPTPSKPLFFLAKLPLNQQTVQTLPFLGNAPLHIGFSKPPPHPLKVGSFIELPKYLSFSSLIPSYLLKATKLLGGISQFQFLVMTEKNILAYKLFLSLNISYFNLFLCENCNPCYKNVTNLFLSKPSLKLRSCQTTPCLKIWLEAQPPPHPLPPSPPAEGMVPTTIVKNSYLQESETLFER